MSARDDYPERPDVLYTIDPGRWKDMCDEIDRLREANAFLSATLADHLPTVVLPYPHAIVKIDGRWMNVRLQPEEPK